MSLMILFQLLPPYQFTSTLARDDRTPPWVALIEDVDILSVPEEPVQQESAFPSFLESLHNVGIAIPQGISFLDSPDRGIFRALTVSHGKVRRLG